MQIELLQNMQLADYVVFFDKVRERFIGNYPDEWKSEYLRESLYNYDVAVVGAYDTFRPSLWNVDDKKSLNKQQQRIMEMAKSFDISAGITIPNYAQDKFLTFAFANQKNLAVETDKFVTLSILMFIKNENKAIVDSFSYYVKGLRYTLQNTEKLNNELLQEMRCIKLFNQSLYRTDLKEVIDRSVAQSIALLNQAKNGSISSSV